MSQAGIINTASGPVPPEVPIDFETDDGTAESAANVITFTTNDTNENFDNGITNTGSGNTVTHLITNRATGTVTTADGNITTLITLPLTTSAGTVYVWGNVQAFQASAPASGSYNFSGCFRTTGVAATEIGTNYADVFEDVSFNNAGVDIFLGASGNNAVLSVQGIAATSINWNGLIEYRQVN